MKKIAFTLTALLILLTPKVFANHHNPCCGEKAPCCSHNAACCK